MQRSLSPPWLVKRFYNQGEFSEIKGILKRYNLRTVCAEALCPNMSECYSRGMFTLLILGTKCTRSCKFCFVKKEKPSLSFAEEIENISQVVKLLDLKYLVLTSVTRDDLADKGAGHFAEIIKTVKSLKPSLIIEALIPDFGGEETLIELVIKSGLDILAHNIETVPRLYPEIRPEAEYPLSLKVLKTAKKFGSLTKSGLILGLGEKEDEVLAVIAELAHREVDILTLGQYLKPGEENFAVQEFISPEKFEFYKNFAYTLGFRYVLAGPFVRSSYRAEEIIVEIKNNQKGGKMEVILPELGEGINQATVSYWYFEEGEQIEEGVDLVELATEKATFNLPSPTAGRLKKIYFNVGEVVRVGEVLAIIE
ncbi:MAG: lipoyl synthase [Candidatus Omnitrophica bacterium]|nr:lipoyl synthase [Candidatus Omnitrophota bacterium]MCM8793646.1 lipoyl synthase [Candidatus Omnitrophota bacterium]